VAHSPASIGDRIDCSASYPPANNITNWESRQRLPETCSFIRLVALWQNPKRKQRTLHSSSAQPHQQFRTHVLVLLKDAMHHVYLHG
jgi:hypothetical protein